MNSNKIYIEALGLVDKHFSGVGQYISGLLKGLDDLIGEDIAAHITPPEIYVLIPWNNLDKFKQFNFKHLKVKRIPIHSRILGALWHRGLMPPIDIFVGHGYYIFTRFVSMPLLFSKYAVIIYDLSYELYPQYSEDRNAEFLSKKVPKTVQKADFVITISENAKDEIASLYQVTRGKITVAYPAADLSIFRRGNKIEIEKVKEKYGVKRKYAISLSNLEPRKNIESLVYGYCLLSEKERESLSLLLIGVKGWKTEPLLKTIDAKIKQGYSIIIPNTYVDDSDKVALISGASMLVYPSHYEGFGMPPLEALACGTPVIVSNNSSLPEAVGHIGILLKSNQPKSIRDAIRHELKHPSNLLTTGPLHAQKFSWKASAEKIIELASTG